MLSKELLPEPLGQKTIQFSLPFISQLILSSIFLSASVFSTEVNFKKDI